MPEKLDREMDEVVLAGGQASSSEPPECENNGWRASALGRSGGILATLTLGAGTGMGASWTLVTPT